MTDDPRLYTDWTLVARTRNWPVLLGAGLATLIGLFLFGAALGNLAARRSRQSPVAAGPAPVAVAPAQFDQSPGTVLSVTDSGGNVQDVVIFSFRLRKGGCGSAGARPGHGAYLIADVLVHQTKGTGAVSPLLLTFVADDGTTADPAGGELSHCATNRLGSTDALRTGSKRAGQIVFDVASPRGSVEYAPDGPGGAAAGSWKSA